MSEDQDTEDVLSAESIPDVMYNSLKRKWTVWFYRNDKRRSWDNNQHPVASFKTVEDFWAIHNYLLPAGQLPLGCDYSVFKDDVKPMWEDDENRFGGRWFITLSHNHQNLNEYWLETLICLIGDIFEELSSEVCGAVISVRAKGDKIALWLRDCQQHDVIDKIGHIWKSKLGLSELHFESHVDTITNRYTQNNLHNPA